MAVTALLACAVVPWLLFPGPSIFGVAIAAAAVCWLGFRRAGWAGGPRRIIRVNWRAENAGGQWFLTDARGREFAAELRPDTRVAAGCVWLRWNAEGIRSMLLIRGDVATLELRRLGLRLRLEGACRSRQLAAPAA